MAVSSPVAANRDVASWPRTSRITSLPADVIVPGAIAALVAAVLMIGGPWSTNDGPVHVAFANLLNHLGDAGHPLQQQVYRLDTRLQPNLLGDLLIAGLMRLTTPAAAEAVVQFLSLVGPMLASLLAFRQIARTSGWLCIFVFTLSINQLFFYGLYNFALSTAMFFLVVAAQYRLMATPSARGAALLGGALILALLCHAGGFIAACSAVMAMVLAGLASSSMRGVPLSAAVAGQRWSVLGLVLPLPLFGYALVLNSGGKILYGIGLLERLKQFVTLYLFRLHGGLEPARAALIAALTGGTVVTLRWAWRHRATLAVDQRDRLIATVAAAVVSVVVMLAMPDTMGGGWTHFRRFELFPLFWSLLIVAEFPISRRRHRAGLLTAAGLAAIFFGAAVLRSRIVQPHVAALAAVDRLVGAHCTVLPLVIAATAVDLRGEPFTYKPFLHAASRLELSRDRVVLYNYLARLMVYPVHFRDAFEPQENLFHWPRERQMDSLIMPPDVAGYERRTGLHVDYVLVWGAPGNALPRARPAIDALLATSLPLYATANGPLALYRRPGHADSMCEG